MSGPKYKDFVGARPVAEDFGLEDLGGRVGLRALADGERRSVHPRPAANVKFGGWTKSVGEGGVAAVHVSNGAGVVVADDIVRTLLVVRRQVAVGEVVADQALVAGKSSTLENREREARQTTHVDLVMKPNPWRH